MCAAAVAPIFLSLIVKQTVPFAGSMRSVAVPLPSGSPFIGTSFLPESVALSVVDAALPTAGRTTRMASAPSAATTMSLRIRKTSSSGWASRSTHAHAPGFSARERPPQRPLRR
jgi:hypothetical protein